MGEEGRLKRTIAPIAFALFFAFAWPTPYKRLPYKSVFVNRILIAAGYSVSDSRSSGPLWLIPWLVIGAAVGYGAERLGLREKSEAKGNMR